MKEEASLYDTHQFWDTQPVPHANDKVEETDYDKPIEVKTLDDVRKDPLPLPKGYSWKDLDLNDDAEAKDLYDLLTKNYVEDDEAMFRFDYSVPFLRWALMPPGYKPEWLVGVRAGKKERLFGFISGIPVKMKVNGQEVMMAEINFLCVHKDLRAKKLAPLLIKEITRRVNMCNIWQAVYTAGVKIPTPISGAQYWHRSINVKKLIDVRFSSLPPNTPLNRQIRLLKIPDEPTISNISVMQQKHVPEVTQMLNDYLQKFKLWMHFSEEEVEHFLLPRNKVIYSYVIKDSEKKITDFFSFYNLPSSILKHPDYDTLNVAYSYYSFSKTERYQELTRNALIKAKQNDFDVFNILDL